MDSTTVYPLVITIPLDKDLLAAKQIVRDVINDHDNVLDKDADIIVTTVTKDTVELKTLIKTRDLDTSFDTLSDLREQVLTNLRQLDYFNK